MKPSSRRTLEAEMRTAIGDVAIMTEEWTDAIEVLGTNPTHHLQLSLLPDTMNASARFADSWSPHRFERLGSLFLFPAHRQVHVRSDCRVQRSITCRLSPDGLAQWFDGELEWTDNRLAACLNVGNPNIRQLMWRIGDELRDAAVGREAIVELMVAQVAIELARYLGRIDDGAVGGGLAPWRLRMIDDYLLENSGKATLADLAALCNLSVRHLARAFRVSRKRSLGDHIAAQRMEQARRLLGHGVSVKETAFAVGFTEPTNFAAAFRRSTGESPRQYLQRTCVTHLELAADSDEA